MAMSKDPVIALLAKLVLRDEQAHHGVLHQIMASVSQSPYWRSKADPVPPGATFTEDEARLMRALISRMLQEERDSQAEIKALAHEVRGFRDGLYTLLLEVMQDDSRKHERVLRFAHAYLERFAPDPAQAFSPAEMLP